MNIFRSSQPLYKLPIPISGEIIQHNNTWSSTKSTYFMNEIVADIETFPFMGFIFDKHRFLHTQGHQVYQ